MPPTVRTRNTFAVQLPAGVPLREPGRSIPLSPFDAYWVALPPVRRVFLFIPPPGPGIPFADVVRALACSLERVIPAFHPFASALTYSPESRAVSIVLPEGACGVAFVEAEADINFERLVEEGTEHDEDALLLLVPDIKRDELPAPVMAVQVTKFVGGGVALGVTVHHVVADGRGLWAFLEMWAAAAGVQDQEGRVATSPIPTPLHDRRLVSFCGDEELSRLFLLQVAPELPIIRKQNPAPEQGSPLSRRTFTFAAPTVRLLNAAPHRGRHRQGAVHLRFAGGARMGVHRTGQRLHRRRPGLRLLPRRLSGPYVAVGAWYILRQLRRRLPGLATRVGPHRTQRR